MTFGGSRLFLFKPVGTEIIFPFAQNFCFYFAVFSRHHCAPRTFFDQPMRLLVSLAAVLSRHATLLPMEERCVTRHRTAARETMRLQVWNDCKKSFPFDLESFRNFQPKILAKWKAPWFLYDTIRTCKVELLVD